MRRPALVATITTICLTGVLSQKKRADDLTAQSRAALRNLVAQNTAASKASANAIAVLVFPKVVKAGFVVGAQGGEGVLFVHGKPSGHYRTMGGSYGLQAGVQKFGYALF
ncbi:MAG TPA: hypothetical protein VLQ90_12740 [Pyrinomonadaceae bacterium]|nr:hypothetical protein [Pyrinomonadaceae bacterium]